MLPTQGGRGVVHDMWVVTRRSLPTFGRWAARGELCACCSFLSLRLPWVYTCTYSLGHNIYPAWSWSNADEDLDPYIDIFLPRHFAGTFFHLSLFEIHYRYMCIYFMDPWKFCNFYQPCVCPAAPVGKRDRLQIGWSSQGGYRWWCFVLFCFVFWSFF